MKTNFKLLALAVLVLAVGFSSCGKNNDTMLADGEKKVTVTINLNGTSARSEGSSTANGVTPNFNDLKLFFVGGGFVQKVETITSGLVNNAQNTQSFIVPSSTTKVYAIGNVEAPLNSPSTFPAAGSPESAVKALLMEVDKQISAENVNLSAGQGASGTAAAGIDFSSSDEAEFNLYPAVARYEIKKVSSSNTVVTGVEQPLASFKLTGIFITNTYRTLGLDYSTLPSLTADIINAGPGTSGFETTGIPSYLKDYPLNASNQAGLSFTPENGGTFWQYFVMPPVSGKGTILEGNTEAESSLPMIVLEISDATTAITPNGPTYASKCYLNVRKLVYNGGTNNGQEITYLEPGKVYMIDDILFGGEHLTEVPGENHQKSVIVKVTVQPWVGENVKPAL